MANRSLGIHGGYRPIDFTDVSTDELEALVHGGHSESVGVVVELLAQGRPVRLREVLDETMRSAWGRPRLEPAAIAVRS